MLQDSDQNGPRDGRLVVTFNMGAVEDGAATREKGFRVFKDVPWVRIIVPAERDVYHQPAWIDESEYPIQGAHNVRFPQQWARFKAGMADQTTGFPLSEWPQCLRSHVEQLAAMRVRTVEQLAAIADGSLQHMGPGYLALRAKAQAFLKQREADAPMELVKSELATRDNEIQLLKAQMAELLAHKGLSVPRATQPVAPEAPQLAPDESIEAAPSVAAKRRGRPPKAKPEAPHAA